MTTDKLLQTPIVNASAPSAAGLLPETLKRALVSQLHPKMLLAILLPIFIALLGALLLFFFLWTPLTAWLEQFLGSGPMHTVDQWLLAWGLFSLASGLAPVLTLFILLPIAGLLGLIVAAVVIMPLVLSHLGQRDYPNLARKGRYANTSSAINALWVGLVFIVGWVITLPLWLIPPLAIILPIFWWAFAFNRILRVDALVEHATPAERQWLCQRYNRSYWFLGLILALANFLPPLWLVLPVFSALVFAHFSLEALQRLRAHTSLNDSSGADISMASE